MAITRSGTGRQRMSKIVIHNDAVYLCDQVAKTLMMILTSRHTRCLKKIDDLLKQAGSGRKHILSATIYPKDMKYFSAMSEIWDAWVIEGFSPACARVETSLARPELLVEMSVIAAVK